MRTRRPPTWLLTAGTVAVAGVALLLARPAAAGLFMMIFIMAGLPALYRLRRYARSPRDAGQVRSFAAEDRRGVPDGHSSAGAADGPASDADGGHVPRASTQPVTRLGVVRPRDV